MGGAVSLQTMAEEGTVLKSRKIRTASSEWMAGVSALAILSALAIAPAYAQEEPGEIETITVTGFRASLAKALDMKRTSLDASDSIMAEDIAKFPDMNVSESLQRIPGVVVQRESGEGRQITVRGLGAQFTRVLINGVEAIATVGSQDVSTSGGGTNRGRGFDFNVFASDLFQQLTVHKSNSASMEEGSLGATVELRTAHPFDHPGFVFTTSGQFGYQSLAKSGNPRVAALVSDTFLGGRLGVLVSGAFSTTNTLEEGTSSVRWMSNLGSGSSPTSSSDFATYKGLATTVGDEINTAFRPRFPRYDIVTVHSKRFGLTGSVQWQPDEATLFTVDTLFADFAQIRNEYYLEANSFSVGGAGSTSTYTNTIDNATHYVTSLGVGSINVLDYTIGGDTGLDAKLNSTSTIERLEATNVGLRNEHRLDHLDTRFMQVTVDGSHSFSDSFKLHTLWGWTESHHRNPIQTTLAADLGCSGTGSGIATKKLTSTSCTNGAGTADNPYIYDYSQGNMPLLSTGNLDPTSTASWFLSNVRERQDFAYNSFRTAAVDFEWKPLDEITLSGGFDFRNYGFGTQELRRATSATSTGENSSIPNAVRSTDLSTYVKAVTLRGIDVPSGSTKTWFVANLDKANDVIGIWNQSVFPLYESAGLSNSGTVRENDIAGWMQMAWDTALFNMPFRGDIGVRYIQTQEHTVGYTSLNSTISELKGHLVYHDFLPTLNAVLEPMDDLLIRFNAGYAMTRPGLTSLLPVGSVSVTGSNGTAKLGNPALPPMRSKNLDLSFEWYYDKGSMLSVAGFWKHLDNFLQTQSVPGTWNTNPFGFDASMFVGACGGTGSDWNTISNSYCIGLGGENMKWVFSTQKSVKGAPLWGTEINWQQQLNFLPAPFDSLGVLANFTYVQAQQSYYDTSGNLLMKADLTNMSRISYNGTVYYDDGTFQARMTGAFRSHYIIDANILSSYNNYGIFSKSTFNLDASVSYKLNEQVMFTFDAINITNQASNIYADKNAKRSYQYHETGPVYYAGVKYSY